MTTGKGEVAVAQTLSRFRNIGFIFCGLALAVSVMVIFDVPIWLLFESDLPARPLFAPLNAIAALSAALLAASVNGKRRFRQVGVVLAWVVVLAGTAIALLYLTSSSQIGSDWVASPRTAIGFLLIGLALVLFNVETRNGTRPSEYLALVAGAVALVSLLGHLFESSIFYGFQTFLARGIGMAFSEALGVFLIAAALPLLYPERGHVRLLASDTMGGYLARRLLIAAILIPVLVGQVVMWGGDAGYYGSSLHLPLFAVSTIAVFLVLTWITSARLDDSEIELRRETSFVEILEKAAAIASEAKTFEEAIKRSLERICVLWSFPIGHAYLLLEETRTLSPSKIWCVSDGTRFAAFIEETENTTLHSGVGIVGRSFEQKAPIWQDEPATSHGFGRAKSAKAVGIRAGFAFPIFVRSEVVAVLEFFTDRRVEADQRMLEVVSKFGKLLGGALERKQAQDALAARDERYRLFEENVKDYAIWILDREGRMMTWPAGAGRLTGYIAQEALGRRFVEFYFKDVADAGVFDADLRAATTDGRTEREGWVTRRDGTRIWVSISITALRDEQKSLHGFVVIMQDLTTRRQAEMHIRETSNDLARSNQELEQFAYVASHDLREPLRMISSYTQLLERKYRGVLDQKGERFLTYIIEGVSRMEALINALLLYSRAGRVTVAPEECDLERIFGQALANLKAAIDESKALITHDPLPRLLGHPQQLGQVFQNLISNAISYRREDVSPRIHVSAKPGDNQEWQFSVSDNGIGIERQYWDRVFVAFQRLQARRRSSGTGIGLAICKRVVERCGGHIWIESEPGKGSTFYFTLPARGAEKAERSPVGSAA